TAQLIGLELQEQVVDGSVDVVVAHRSGLPVGVGGMYTAVDSHPTSRRRCAHPGRRARLHRPIRAGGLRSASTPGTRMRLRSVRHRSLFTRAEQAALLSAGAAAPLAYQRTLMPRSTSDQALVSGLALATNYGIVAATQDAIQATALLLRGGARGAV